jgi:hypothetical protein
VLFQGVYGLLVCGVLLAFERRGRAAALLTQHAGATPRLIPGCLTCPPVPLPCPAPVAAAGVRLWAVAGSCLHDDEHQEPGWHARVDGARSASAPPAALHADMHGCGPSPQCCNHCKHAFPNLLLWLTHLWHPPTHPPTHPSTHPSIPPLRLCLPAPPPALPAMQRCCGRSPTTKSVTSIPMGCASGSW